jgi:tetratricopeptide (TPR) repeat protein
LAVHWAHRVADRFPDGQLYVNLRGHATSPPHRPIDALAGFLLGLGVPADKVPDDLENAAALYRSRLAGRRVLVLLDNAADAAQVRPLLPGSPGCTVLVTSRDRLTGLVARDGAHPCPLDVLPPDEAVALLTRTIGADRVTAEPAATAELARLCAYLPLALRIAAANLAARPRSGIGGYVARLRTGDRLAALSVDGDAETAVRATLELSYAALPAAERRMFRLLGLVPGPDVTAETAAALAGGTPDEAAAVLDRLADRHLTDEHIEGRHSMHDLLRLYAAEMATAEDSAAERRAATARLADHYLHAVDSSASLLRPHLLRLPRPEGGAAPPAPRFTDPSEALAWLDAERANLVATVVYLAAHGHHRAAWLLTNPLQAYFHARLNIVDWQAVNEAGLRAAEAAGDLHAQAAGELGLGCLHDTQCRFAAAAAHYRRSLELARRAGWPDCEGVVLNNLAREYWVSGQLRETADHLSQALVLKRRAGWPAGEAVTLANLGLVYAELGRAEGVAAHLDRAMEYLTEALDLHRRTGDRNNEVETLRVLAATHLDAGRHGVALEVAERAVALAREAADLRFETLALNTLATVYARLGDFPPAVERHRQALRIARDIGDRQMEAQILLDRADTDARRGQRDEARGHVDAAQAIIGELGLRLLERKAQAVRTWLDRADRGETPQVTASAARA